jgi:DNA-binding NarL/FixJ family response regulator
MQPRKIIMVDGSRFLREMLKRVIAKTPGLQLVDEITDLASLSSAIEQTGAQWMVVSYPPNGKLPEAIESSLAAHPSVRVLALATDGSQVKMKWVEPRESAVAVAADGSQVKMNWIESREKILDDLSLDELIAVLHEDSPANV